MLRILRIVGPLTYLLLQSLGTLAYGQEATSKIPQPMSWYERAWGIALKPGNYSAREMRERAEEACKARTGLGWQWCVGDQMCLQTQEPEKCKNMRVAAGDKERAVFAASLASARRCAEGKNQSARLDCFGRAMCAEASDQVTCARKLEKFDRGLVAHEKAGVQCRGLRGDPLKDCSRQFEPQLTEPVSE